MRFFLDTEFLDAADSTQLISLGIVSSTGCEFYAVSADFDQAAVAADPWLAGNVLPGLKDFGSPSPHPEAVIAADLAAWCASVGDGETSEVWAWNGSYDFYLLAKLFGRQLDIPDAVPRHFYDLKQWAHALGDVTVPAQSDGMHNALADAWHDKATFDWLTDYSNATRQNNAR